MSLLVETQSALSENSSVLREVLNQSCNLAIWERDLPFNVSHSFPDNDASVRLTISPEAHSPALQSAMVAAGFSDDALLADLIADIEKLCALFLPVAGTDKLALRIEVVTGNACRKFHGDYVTARLITTYCGSGTQWLDQRDADRVIAGEEPEYIHQLTEGDVAIFKGRLSTETPAIHRSPPIEGTAEKRLILVLDPCEGDAVQ